MTNDAIREARLDRLRRLVEAAGGPAAFARKHQEVDATYVSQLLNGHRNFGERAARTMERRIGLKHGDLDRQPTEEFPAEISALLRTITDAVRDGSLSPEQAQAFDGFIKNTTANPSEARTTARDLSAAYHVGAGQRATPNREKNHAEWPFSRVSLERILSLSKIDLAYVEGKLSAAIEECEATAAKRRTSGRA